MPPRISSQLLNNSELDSSFLDFYLHFLCQQNSTVQAFPALWVVENLLEIQNKDLKYLKGFAFTKAIKMPWKHTAHEVLRELKLQYKQDIGGWKVCICILKRQR